MKPAPHGEATYTVAFPAVCSPVPSLPQLTRLIESSGKNPEAIDADYSALLSYKYPHWLYHLQILSEFDPGFSSVRRFLPVQPFWLMELKRLFGISKSPYEIQCLEAINAVDTDYLAECSPYTFGIPREINMRSWSLAAAIGLASAHLKRPVPPWVVCSGCLPSNLTAFLPLEKTAKMDTKIRLCRGDDAHNLEPLVSRMCPQDRPCRFHGPRHRRAISGRVRLMIIPTEITMGDDHSPCDLIDPSIQRKLNLNQIEANLNDFFNHDDFQKTVDRLRQNAMLVVQVPSVWEALVVLGLNALPHFPEALLEYNRVHCFLAHRNT